MPLNTQIKRDGELLKLRWSDFHVCAMAIAAATDDGPEHCRLYPDPVALFDELREKNWIDEDGNATDEPIPITPSMAFRIGYGELSLTPLNKGSYTLKHSHKFVDVTDGEVLELEPGDELMAWRTMKS